MTLEPEAIDRPAAPIVEKLVSGGQTGVDRAGLDVAIALGIEHGGWCPRGRRAEDGRIPECYRLTETDSADYAIRTEQNVLDSDGTLILYLAELRGGTELTYRLAQKHGKPSFLIDLSRQESSGPLRQWLLDQKIHVLNVAGPRASQNEAIYELARVYLESVLVAE